MQMLSRLVSRAKYLCLISSTFLLNNVFATDSTGVAQLDTQATAFETGVRVFAKWGGILMIVIAGVIFGSGKAQGQSGHLLFGIVLAIGLIMGAWGWFSDNFSYGFAF